MSTINVSTSGDKPRAWKDSGKPRPIYSMEECYAVGKQVIFGFNGFEMNFSELDTLNVNGSPVAGNAETKANAISDALKSFFPKAPGSAGGPGGSYSLNTGEQTIVANSVDQVAFNLTGGVNLPADKTKISVVKNRAVFLQQSDFTRTDADTITVATDFKCAVDDIITVKWMDLVSS